MSAELLVVAREIVATEDALHELEVSLQGIANVGPSAEEADAARFVEVVLDLRDEAREAQLRAREFGHPTAQDARGVLSTYRFGLACLELTVEDCLLRMRGGEPPELNNLQPWTAHIAAAAEQMRALPGVQG